MLSERSPSPSPTKGLCGRSELMANSDILAVCEPTEAKTDIRFYNPSD